MTLPLVNFQTYLRIGPHPFSLLSQRSEPVNMPSIKREIDWHNIRLIFFCAPQADLGKLTQPLVKARDQV